MADPVETYSLEEVVHVRIKCHVAHLHGGAIDSTILRLQKWMRAQEIFSVQTLLVSAGEYIGLFAAEDAEKVDGWLTDHGAQKCEASEVKKAQES